MEIDVPVAVAADGHDPHAGGDGELEVGQAPVRHVRSFPDHHAVRHLLGLGQVGHELAGYSELVGDDAGDVDGVVADLGVSSAQLDQRERGFSLAGEGPIDMRMDPTEGETALELIGRSGAEELANVIYRYGEERRSRKIARSVRRAYEEGELETTADLRRAVHRATGPRRGRIDPATKTFQALRIAVNEELSNLAVILDKAADHLVAGGRFCVISFHSLEDKIVKSNIINGSAKNFIFEECAPQEIPLGCKFNGMRCT